MKAMKRGLLVSGALIIISGALILFGGLSSLISDILFMREAEKVEASVKGFYAMDGTMTKNRDEAYYMGVSYEYAIGLYDNLMDVFAVPRSINAGDRVTVYCRPDDPGEVRLIKFRIPLVLCPIGLAAVLTGTTGILLLVRKNNREEKQ